jgi:nicotinate-nucleotide adenylyltransferase
MSAPLGILGGTFDPVHFGHLRLAEEAAEILGLERVRWIPAGLPWHRGTPLATPDQRRDMVSLAIAGNPLFELDDAEVKQNTPSYTVATLERLRQALGAARPIVVLLGSDAFRGLETWHRWHEIFALAHVFVAQRPGHELDPVSLPSALAAEWRNRSGAIAAIQSQVGGRIVTKVESVFADPADYSPIK